MRIWLIIGGCQFGCQKWLVETTVRWHRLHNYSQKASHRCLRLFFIAFKCAENSSLSVVIQTGKNVFGNLWEIKEEPSARSDNIYCSLFKWYIVGHCSFTGYVKRLKDLDFKVENPPLMLFQLSQSHWSLSKVWFTSQVSVLAFLCSLISSRILILEGFFTS